MAAADTRLQPWLVLRVYLAEEQSGRARLGTDEADISGCDEGELCSVYGEWRSVIGSLSYHFTGKDLPRRKIRFVGDMGLASCRPLSCEGFD